MRDFGGAFDIDPHEYWTREDLDELMATVSDMNPEFKITGMYLKDHKDILDIDYRDKYDNEYHFNEEVILDYKKHPTCSDMCKYYAPVVFDLINAELKEHLADFEME